MSGVSAVRLHGMTVASVKELQVAAQSLHLAQLRPLDISNQPTRPRNVFTRAGKDKVELKWTLGGNQP